MARQEIVDRAYAAEEARTLLEQAIKQNRSMLLVTCREARRSDAMSIHRTRFNCKNRNIATLMIAGLVHMIMEGTNTSLKEIMAAVRRAVVLGWMDEGE